MEEPFQPYSNYFSNSYMSISKGGVYLSPPPFHPIAISRQASRGGTGGPEPPPPPRFVRGEVLRRGLMGRRGGPTVVLPYYYLFFGSLRSPVVHKHITYIYVLQAQCSVWNGHPFSIFLLSEL